MGALTCVFFTQSLSEMAPLSRFTHWRNQVRDIEARMGARKDRFTLLQDNRSLRPMRLRVFLFQA
jgi:hypothetical protein